MHYERLKQKFQGGKVYFVCDMGDISNCPKQNRELILDVAAMNRDSIFLFCTKKPSIYLDWREYPENLILGATIETDMEIVKGYSSAPSPTNRFTALHMLRETEPEVKIALAIEPILEFSDDFEKQIDKIEPNIIWIGYDNYKHKLKEPPLPKTMKLTENLEAKGYTVYRKTLRKAWYEK
jgi:DNA repair photolyase